jgi:predicted metal-dependent HD superfamily phosphohydrolase
MVVNKELAERLFPRFEGLVQRNHYWLSSRETLFSEIVKRYFEEHRFYHNLEHISDCLDKFDEVKNQGLIKIPDELEMAVFYHDIIYDVNKINNEELSAKLMSAKLQKIGMDKKFVAGVNNLIMDTWKHELGKHPDSGYMVDIDLFVGLGTDWEQFVDNRKKIDKEYRTKYNEKEKLIGTVMFYNNMLNRKKIFLTDYFNSKYECQARENMKKSIELLAA